MTGKAGSVPATPTGQRTPYEPIIEGRLVASASAGDFDQWSVVRHDGSRWCFWVEDDARSHAAAVGGVVEVRHVWIEADPWGVPFENQPSDLVTDTLAPGASGSSVQPS